MGAVEILALVNTLSQVIATLIDHARQQGATPEQLAQARTDALVRFDAAAEAVRTAEPPVA